MGAGINLRGFEIENRCGFTLEKIGEVLCVGLVSMCIEGSKVGNSVLRVGLCKEMSIFQDKSCNKGQL